ncbi:MAG: hypothetical protein ACK55Z_02365 [bacterium]
MRRLGDLVRQRRRGVGAEGAEPERWLFRREQALHGRADRLRHNPLNRRRVR